MLEEVSESSLIVISFLQEFISNHKEPVSSSYGRMDAGSRASYSQLGNTTYPSSSLSAQSYGGYESSDFGGYGNYRY